MKKKRHSSPSHGPSAKASRRNPPESPPPPSKESHRTAGKNRPRRIASSPYSSVRGARSASPPNYSPPPPAKYRRRNSSSDSPERKPALMDSKLRHKSKYRDAVGRPVACPFCSDQLLDLGPHLLKHHTHQAFQCISCNDKVFTELEAAVEHGRSVHGHVDPLEQGRIVLPRCLGRATCRFCKPNQHFVGFELGDLGTPLKKFNIKIGQITFMFTNFFSKAQLYGF